MQKQCFFLDKKEPECRHGTSGWEKTLLHIAVCLEKMCQNAVPARSGWKKHHSEDLVMTDEIRPVFEFGNERFDKNSTSTEFFTSYLLSTHTISLVTSSLLTPSD